MNIDLDSDTNVSALLFNKIELYQRLNVKALEFCRA